MLLLKKKVIGDFHVYHRVKFCTNASGSEKATGFMTLSEKSTREQYDHRKTIWVLGGKLFVFSFLSTCCCGSLSRSLFLCILDLMCGLWVCARGPVSPCGWQCVGTLPGFLFLPHSLSAISWVPWPTPSRPSSAFLSPFILCLGLTPLSSLTFSFPVHLCLLYLLWSDLDFCFQFVSSALSATGFRGRDGSCLALGRTAWPEENEFYFSFSQKINTK